MAREPSNADIATARTEWRPTREDLETILVPLYFSPGNYDHEAGDTTRRARWEYFPCQHMITRGMQVYRAGQEDWQAVESQHAASTNDASSGSYYFYTNGNTLFIHINDWLATETDLGGGDPKADNGPNFMSAAYEDQRAWLEATLKEHRHKYKWCFMFGHTAIDEASPTYSNSLADDANSRTHLIGLHETYKVNAYFHGHWLGWRCAKTTYANGHVTWYVCSNFGTDNGSGAMDTTSGTWNGQMAVAHIRIGVGTNGIDDADGCKIDLVTVGFLTDNPNVVVNTSSINNGVITSATGTVVDHTNTARSITSADKLARVINFGSKWVYSDTTAPDLSNSVDFITGSQKFFRETFSPEMFNFDVTGSTVNLWKIDNAPFFTGIGDDWSSPWGANNVTAGSAIILRRELPSWVSDYDEYDGRDETPITTTGGFLNNPNYYIKRFDISNDLEPTEVQINYFINDAAFIWINGELAWNSSGEGGIPSAGSSTTAFTETNRPTVDTTWVAENSGTTLASFEPVKSTADNSTNANDSRIRTPTINYDSPDQPIKIDNPSVINKLRNRDNVIAVLLLQGRETSAQAARRGTSGGFDLELIILGTAKANLFAPHMTSPRGSLAFNRGTVDIVWTINDPLSNDSSMPNDSVTYEIEYTDDYRASDTNWHTVKRRIKYSDTSFTWKVGKSIKSNTVRIRMRAVSSFDESVSSWSISDEFSINVFELIPPAIINPLSDILYTDFILIILDETLTRNTYHQKVRYTLEYSSRKRDIDWTIIVADISVGRNVVRWNLENVASSDDYILRLTVKNASTTCVDEVDPAPDQISRRFVHNVHIQQSGMFLIDTKPPEAILEIEGGSTVSNQLDQVVNIFAEDATTGVETIRLRECDASGDLSLGDLEDPEDPTGGCLPLSEIVTDFDAFGKSIGFSPKTKWDFEDASGLKKLEALLTDVGGNTSLQEQVKVFLSVFSAEYPINDFIVVIEQRLKITVDDTQSPPVVTSDVATFEVVYLLGNNGNFWILEPFARFLYTFGTAVETLKLLEFNDSIYIFTYNAATSTGEIYTHNVTEPTLLFTFTDAVGGGRAFTTAVGIFNNVLYIGLESGSLWSFDGISFAELTPPVSAPIASIFGDKEYLYIGYENNQNMVLYNGTIFSTLDLE